MVRHCQIVMGPAGVGKSTYCATMHEHCENARRRVHVVNLDPAAEAFKYPISLDVRDLITVEDVMSELNYGPNGGLIYCMEYLQQNMEWLKDEIDQFGDDDYLIFDCPGQIELYSHIPVMRELTDTLKKWGISVCGVYLIDSMFLCDPTKFVSGVLCSLSAMVQMELPHINVLTKCDLVSKEEVAKFLDPNTSSLLQDLIALTPPRLKPLNKAINSLINDYSMVSFVPMDVSDEDSIALVLQYVDHAIQYGEDAEPKDRSFDQPDELG